MSHALILMLETTPGLSSIPGGQPMLRRRFYVPSAIVSYGATTFSAVHESQLHPPHPPAETRHHTS